MEQPEDGGSSSGVGPAAGGAQRRLLAEPQEESALAALARQQQERLAKLHTEGPDIEQVQQQRRDKQLLQAAAPQSDGPQEASQQATQQVQAMAL